ncbi:MAG: hypothetical protein NVS2B6_11890 [Thermoleophilaceae bacterium]
MAEGTVREQVGDVISKAKRCVVAETPTAADDNGRVGIVRGALRTFGEGDMDSFLDALKESVEWEAPAGKHFPGNGEREGREAVKTGFVEDAERTYSSFGFRPESFFEADDDDAVIVLGRFLGEGVEGGSVDSPAVQIWEFEGNTASRILIVADSVAFPKVITERDEKEKQRKQEEEKKREESGEGEGEGAKSKAGGEDANEGEQERKDEQAGRSGSGDRVREKESGDGG